MKLKSGPVVFDNGQRGVFITEEDLARGGDAFRALARHNIGLAKDMDESGYNVWKVMWLLLNSQKNNTAYDYVERQHIKINDR